MFRTVIHVALWLLLFSSSVHAACDTVGLPFVRSDLGLYQTVVTSGAACGGNEEDICIDPVIKARFEQGDFASALEDANSESWVGYVYSLVKLAVVLIFIASMGLMMGLGLCATCGCICCRQSCSHVSPKVTFALVVSFITCTFIALTLPFMYDFDIALSEHALVDTPREFKSLVRRLPNPVSHALVRTVGVTTVNLALDVNTTLSRSLDVVEIRKIHACTVSMLDAGDVIVVHLNGTIQSLRGVTANLPGEVGPTFETINAAVVALRDKLPQMRSHLTAVEVAKSGSSADLANASKSCKRLGAAAQKLSIATDALDDNLASYNSNLPKSSELRELHQLSATFRGSKTVANAQALTTAVDKLEQNVRSMPSFVTMGDNMRMFSVEVRTATNALAALVSNLETINTRLVSFPSRAALTSLLDMIAAQLKSLESADFSRLHKGLVFAKTLVDRLPSAANMSTLLCRLRTLDEDVSCAFNISNIITTVNDSLVRLPIEFDGIPALFGGLRTTISSELQKLDSAGKQLEHVSEFMSDLPNLTFYEEMLKHVENEVSVANSQLVSARDALTSLFSALESVDIAPALSKSSSILSSVESQPLPTEDDISKVQSQQASAEDFLAESATFSAAVQDACDTDLTCALVPDALIDEFDKVVDSLVQIIEAAPDLSGLTAGVKEVQKQIAKLPDMHETSERLDQASKDFSTAPDVKQYNDQLGQVETRLTAMPETDTFSSQFDSMVGQLATLGLEQLNTYSAGLDEFKAFLLKMPRLELELAVDVLNRYEQFVQGPSTTKGTLAAALASIQPESLEAGLKQSGLDATFVKVITVAADAYNLLTGNYFNESAALRQAVEQHSAVIRAIEDRPQPGVTPAVAPSANGDVWYLYNIVVQSSNESENEKLLAAEAYSDFKTPLLHGYKNGDGDVQEYPPGGYKPCVTQKCLENTVAYYDPRDIRFVPIVLPIAMVILAGITLAWRSKCAALTLSFCSLVFVPILLIAIGFVFPLAVGVAGTCASFESIAINIAPIFSPKICNILGGSNHAMYSYDAETGVCMFYTEQLNASLRLRPSELIRSVVDDCKGGGAADLSHEALDDFWNQVSGRLQSRVQSVFREAIRAGTNSLPIRPSLDEAFMKAADSLGNDAVSTVNELRAVLNCHSLHAIYKTAQEAGCCEIGGPIYWHVMVVILFGLCAMCCAGPGGFLAYKYVEEKKERLGRVVSRTPHEHREALIGKKRVAGPSWGLMHRHASDQPCAGIEMSAP